MTNANMLIYECLAQFNSANRYRAHARVDDNFAGFARQEARTWHPSLVDIGVDRFVVSIRTHDSEVIASLAKANWCELEVAKTGSKFVGRVEVTPKKPGQYSSFRDESCAVQYVSTRIANSGALLNLKVTYIAPSMVCISKISRAYTAPSAWFEISGEVSCEAALNQLIVKGIGGSKSFGVGLVNPDNSKIYPAVMLACEQRIAVREAQVA